MRVNIIQYILDTTTLKQKDIAAKVGVSTTQVSKWKKGEYISSDKEEELNKLAGVIDFDLEWTKIVKTKENANKWIDYVHGVNEEDSELEGRVELDSEIIQSLLTVISESGIELPPSPPIEEYINDNNIEDDFERYDYSNIHCLIAQYLESYYCINLWIDQFINFYDNDEILECSLEIYYTSMRYALKHIDEQVLLDNQYNIETYQCFIRDAKLDLSELVEKFCSILVNNGIALITDFYSLLNQAPHDLEDEVMIFNISSSCDKYLSYGEQGALRMLQLLPDVIENILNTKLCINKD